MDKIYINVPSVTYAIKGRDILIRNGFLASFSKNPKTNSRTGCSYSISVDGDVAKAKVILKRNGIKMI